ncbi:MAG: hydroxymethylbilane synthase, partial [Firmicutes bacterium]|nr:hydroxymethylbilane synthase [Bacillota bacterium]
SFLKDFRSDETEIIAKTERSYVRALDGGCTSPVAAYAEISEGKITITGLDVNKEGKPFRMTITGDPADAEYLGRDLALRMKRME